MMQSLFKWCSALLLVAGVMPVAMASGEHEHDEQAASHIDEAMIDAMGLRMAVAGPGVLDVTRVLSGRVHVDPSRVSRVRPRFAGLIEAVDAALWSQVSKGQVLARIQSNDSLQSYDLRAPIGGWIVRREALVGEITGDEPLFVIADLSSLWIEFDVFDHDLDAVRVGQRVNIRGLHDDALGQGVIEQLSPLAIHIAQSVRARVVVDNREGQLRPGQYVSGEVIVSQQSYPLLVQQSAVQQLDGRAVVFEQSGDEFVARPVVLGARDADQVAVLDGLQAGARYVSGNSYLIKADIEKSGAAHHH
ncbi:efflux RND transporter periplasmic adaptor subunit [Oceanococcus atlanticus]|nr:efflux RND transporter periplasmic adaptor subunit [Oceanococcus atlanticus]